MNTCILFSLLHIKYAQNLLFIIDHSAYVQHKAAQEYFMYMLHGGV